MFLIVGNRIMNPAAVASAILDGITDFVKSDKPKSMQLVRITVFQQVSS